LQYFFFMTADNTSLFGRDYIKLSLYQKIKTDRNIGLFRNRAER